MSTQIAFSEGQKLPPIIIGSATPTTKRRVEQFYFSVAQIFESWIARHKSAHTQDAYRRDVLSFIRFLGIKWPERSFMFLTASIKDAQAFRDLMLDENFAPKTINRRISSLSSF